MQITITYAREIAMRGLVSRVLRSADFVLLFLVFPYFLRPAMVVLTGMFPGFDYNGIFGSVYREYEACEG